MFRTIRSNQSFWFRVGVLGAIAALLGTGTVHISSAQEPVKPPPSQRKSVGLPQINVIDKLLAIEVALGQTLGPIDWTPRYQTLYGAYHQDGNPSTLEGKGDNVLALALGIKASDGVLALKGKDVEALNDCAEQIEKLAMQLDVEAQYLQKAHTVKHLANQNLWLEAFLSLGFLQHEVIRMLKDNPEQKDKAVLVVVGGWLQAGRCVTSVILENYTPDLSNILREPRIVQLMIQELDLLPDEMKNDPAVAQVISLIPEIKKRVDVGLYDPVPQADVQWLHTTFDSLVKTIMAPATGAAPAAAAPAPAQPVVPATPIAPPATQ